MSNSKSGFELRTDILGMAMGLLENNREQVMNAHFQLPDEVRKAEDCPIISITTDEVIAEAKKLYEFVNEK
jgi:hypothetical protein